MYYFDKNLCEKAANLIYKSKELVDIAQDAQKINEVLNYPALFSVQNKRDLDNEIKTKYPDIRVFKNIADSIKWKVSSKFLYQYNTVQEIEELKFDLFFLYAFALIRSGEITEYLVFFDKNYME